MNFTQHDAYEMTYSTGEEMGLHDHDYDHYMLVLAGSVEVYNGDDVRAVGAGVGKIEFKAGIRHGWTALEDGTRVLGVYPKGAKHADTRPIDKG